MKAIIQRVTRASVSVNEKLVNSIGRGLCVLIGISRDDTEKDVEYIVRKILNLRLFSKDGEKRWTSSVKDEHLEILCVSQFTLHSVLKGNKLDFHCAMAPDLSRQFYEDFLKQLRASYKPQLIKDGAFGEYMQVGIVNDGPVTIQLDSQEPRKATSTKQPTDGVTQHKQQEPKTV